MRGFTLIEAMISLTIVSVGMLGLANMHVLAGVASSSGRKNSQATAIAHDLMQQVDLWDYSDPRLEDRNPANNSTLIPPRAPDAALGDEEKADFVDGDATGGVATASSSLGGSSFSGIPREQLPHGFQRLWTVKDVDTDGDGTSNFKAIALTVRWQEEGRPGAWRSATFFSSKFNPRQLSLL